MLSSRSLGQRVDGWSLVADTVIAQPLGTGIGTTGSAAEVALDYGGEIDETFGLTADLLPYQPDNYYVKRLLELGPIGLWLTIALLRHVIESGRQTRKRAGPADAAMIDGFIASVLGAAAAAVDRSVPAGSTLRLKVVVPDGLATTDVWFAYDSGSHPSRINIG